MSNTSYSGIPGLFGPKEVGPLERKFTLNEILEIVRAIGQAQGAFDVLMLAKNELTDYQREGITKVLADLRKTGDMIIEKLRS